MMQPMESDAARKFHRVLRMLTLIQSRRGWNASRLASELQVEERTIFRYLDDLEIMGVPYYFDKESDGYRIRSDFHLPPVQITPDEALALSLLCESLAEREQIPHLRPAWRALNKIESMLPAPIRAELESSRPGFTIQTAQANPGDGWSDVYECVRAGIRQGRVLRCAYDSNNSAPDDAAEFDFEPYALFFSVRAWYAVGRHGGRDALRSLKINRFQKCDLTDRTFQKPVFSIDEYLGNAWRMMRGATEYDVEIHFDPQFTPTMSDTNWHKTQKIEFNEDGSSIFRCTVAGLDEIMWWVLGMGPHCKVIRPAELRERILSLSRETVALYGA
ncbi:MAG: WYL domain-containing protein [Phycisphaerae bacterium]|nr:WYL domain-containing protein [Phycisphaerae bacterium]